MAIRFPTGAFRHYRSANTAQIPFGAGLTMMCWYRPINIGGTGVWRGIIGVSDGNPPTEANNYAIEESGASAGGVYMGWKNAGGYANNSPAPIGLTTNVWRHHALVVQMNGASWRLLQYLNGALNSESIPSHAPPAMASARLHIGAADDVAGDGDIACVRVWRRPLTRTEINQERTRLRAGTRQSLLWDVPLFGSDPPGFTITGTGRSMSDHPAGLR